MRTVKMFSYPIKSCRGVQIEEGLVTAQGLRYDREYALCSEGRFISQRSAPKLACVELAINEDHFTASVNGFGKVEIPMQRSSDAELQQFKLRWDMPRKGSNESREADEFFTRYLQKETQLLRIPDLHDKREQTEGDRARPYKDFSPLSIIALTSLAELNKGCDRPVLADSFRANLIIEGSVPYAEDAWREVQIGDLYVSVIGPTRRCSMVNVDQETGVPDAGRHISRVLSASRFGMDCPDSRPGNFFGQNLSPVLEVGTLLRVGDLVTIHSTGEPNWAPAA